MNGGRETLMSNLLTSQGEFSEILCARHRTSPPQSARAPPHTYTPKALVTAALAVPETHMHSPLCLICTNPTPRPHPHPHPTTPRCTAQRALMPLHHTSTQPAPHHASTQQARRPRMPVGRRYPPPTSDARYMAERTSMQRNDRKKKNAGPRHAHSGV